MFFQHQQQALAQRRQQLQQRSEMLRSQLASDAQVLQTPLALADSVRDGWRWLQTHPQWLGLGVALLVVWRPRRALRFGSRLWAGWRLWRGLQRWRAAVGPMLPLRF